MDDRQTPHTTTPATDQNPNMVWEAVERELNGGLLSVILTDTTSGQHNPNVPQQINDLFPGCIPLEIIVSDRGGGTIARRTVELPHTLENAQRLSLEPGTGKGTALRAALKASRGTHILLIDSATTNGLLPHEIAGLFSRMEQDSADAVVGTAEHTDSMRNQPHRRKLLLTMRSAVIKNMLQLPVCAIRNNIKLFRRAALEQVLPRMLVKQHALDLEMIAIAHCTGLRVRETPVTQHPWDNLRIDQPSSFWPVLVDTLALFYRVRILKYYQSAPKLRELESHPMVTIVIAYPEPTRQLHECLTAIEKQEYTNYEVVLLPDSPSDSKAPWKENDGIRIIPTGKLNPAEKRNMGIEAARGAIVAFLDDDAFPSSDWLLHAVPHFAEETVAAVGGPATTPAGDPFLAQLSGRVFSNRLVAGGFVYRYIPGRLREVEDYPSCNLLVRTTVLRELRGFRSVFWPGEDTLLCMEIVHKLKKRIIYDPWVHVYHHRRELFLPHLRQVARYALHRGYFARTFPATSRRASYFIPSLLVIGVLGGVLPAMFFPLCGTLYITVLALYALLTFLFSFSSAFRVWALTWAGIVLTHIVYGARFIAGFVTPQPATKASEFDHTSEELP